jgi:hypothetical protein
MEHTRKDEVIDTRGAQTISPDDVSRTGADPKRTGRSSSDSLVDLTSSSPLEYSLECAMVAGSTILANPKSQILSEQSSFNKMFAGFFSVDASK